MDIEEKIDMVLGQHKRKVSQLDAIKQEMGLYFDEEEAEEIAKSIMREKCAKRIYLTIYSQQRFVYSV